MLNNLKEEDLQEKNELLKSYKNKQEMENQLGTIVESDRKSDQDFNADLEKIDISLFELTAEVIFIYLNDIIQRINNPLSHLNSLKLI